jgi:hypothetical protein
MHTPHPSLKQFPRENGAIVLAIENGETGKLETWSLEQAEHPGFVLLTHYTADGQAMFPGDPDRHDAGAGDMVSYLVGTGR